VLIDFYDGKLRRCRAGNLFHSNHNHLLESLVGRETSCTMLNLSIMRKLSFDDQNLSLDVLDDGR
jgi:hypothetical protein